MGLAPGFLKRRHELPGQSDIGFSHHQIVSPVHSCQMNNGVAAFHKRGQRAGLERLASCRPDVHAGNAVQIGADVGAQQTIRTRHADNHRAVLCQEANSRCTSGRESRSASTCATESRSVL